MGLIITACYISNKYTFALILPRMSLRILLALNLSRFYQKSDRNLLSVDLLDWFLNNNVEAKFSFDYVLLIPLLLVSTKEITSSYSQKHRNRRHNSHGYSKYRLGCFNGSLYIFPFTRSMGEKWTLEIRLIEFRNQTVSIVLSIVPQNVIEIKLKFYFNKTISISKFHWSRVESYIKCIL